MSIIYITGDGTILDLDEFASVGKHGRHLDAFAHLTEKLPSPESMARQLHAIPRYVGGTTTKISVAHHLLWCVQAALTFLLEVVPHASDLHQFQLEVVSHDLGEVISNDIPSPYKRLLGKKTRARLDAVERAFQGAFLAGRPGIVLDRSHHKRKTYTDFVKDLDFLALLPEATLRRRRRKLCGAA